MLNVMDPYTQCFMLRLGIGFYKRKVEKHLFIIYKLKKLYNILK